MSNLVRGAIHGRIVELETDPGLPDGETVELRISRPTQPRTGEGIIRSDGILADDDEWDEIMAEIHQQRKLERRSHLDVSER